jgi:hypothetical protein
MQNTIKVREVMKNSATKHGLYFIIIITILLCSLAAGLSVQSPAYAAGGYSIGSWHQKNPSKYYYNANEGCAYVVTITESAFAPLRKVYYSAYQVSMSTGDINKDEEGNITNAFAKNKQGEDLNAVEIPLSAITYSGNGSYDAHGQRTGTFEVTAYEWAAYLFSVDYEVDGEISTDEGEFLYCTTIDNSKPHIELLGSPSFQDNGYYFEYMVRANEYGAHRSANSGFSSIKTYRILEGSEEPEILSEHTKFTNNLTFYGGILATKGEYFIEAVDGVGNRHTGKVIKIDKDLNKLITINAAEEYFRNEADYAPALISSLRQKYVAWQLLELEDNIAESVITAAYNEVMAALNACSEAKRTFEVRAINTEYVDSFTVEGFDVTSLPFVVKGESAAMNISLAMFDTAEVDKSEVLRLADLPNANRVLAMSIYLTSNLKEIPFTEYETPIKITMSISDYENIAAVAVTQQGGQTVYTKLRLDKGSDWVSVYVPYSDAVINLIIDEGKASFDLRWLYMLFLLIPISGAIVFVFRKKIFRKKTQLTAPTKEQSEK